MAIKFLLVFRTSHFHFEAVCRLVFHQAFHHPHCVGVTFPIFFMDRTSYPAYISRVSSCSLLPIGDL